MKVCIYTQTSIEKNNFGKILHWTWSCLGNLMAHLLKKKFWVKPSLLVNRSVQLSNWKNSLYFPKPGQEDIPT